MHDFVTVSWAKKLLLLAFTLLVVSAPAHAQRSGGAPLPSSPVNQNSLLVVTQSADPGYILRPNDFIQIAVFQEDDLNTATRISQAGTIDFPLVGTLHVGSLSVLKATELIRSKLMEGYLRDPQISLTVIEFAKRRYSVLGEVRLPGTYEMPQQESVTLLEAISNAGGYTKIADPGRVTVARQLPNGKKEIYKLSAKAMARDSNVKPFYVQPEDTITVMESIF